LKRDRLRHVEQHDLPVALLQRKQVFRQVDADENAVNSLDLGNGSRLGAGGQRRRRERQRRRDDRREDECRNDLGHESHSILHC
jgi:hypothetical protein